jgi:hypothetical protein
VRSKRKFRVNDPLPCVEDTFLLTSIEINYIRCLHNRLLIRQAVTISCAAHIYNALFNVAQKNVVAKYITGICANDEVIAALCGTRHAKSADADLWSTKLNLTIETYRSIQALLHYQQPLSCGFACR